MPLDLKMQRKPAGPLAGRRQILLVGAGEPVAALAEVARQQAGFDLVGILDPEPRLKGQSVSGVPVIGWLKDLPLGVFGAVVGLPSVPDGFDREAVFHVLRRRGISLPVLVSADAVCDSSATLYPGTSVLADSRIEAGATIGPNSLIGPGSRIGRDCVVSEHAVVNAGANVTAFDSPGGPAASPRSLAAAIATEKDSIRTVIRRINRSRMEIVLITDENDVLKGVITDGDVRRAILAGIDLEGPASGVMNQNPVMVPVGTSRAAMLDLMRERSIRHVPVVDSQQRPVRIEVMQTILENNRGIGAVIMAGGLGSRMRPLTDEMPKPLVPVAGRPILDHLLSGVRAAGVEDVAIAVNYLADAVREHVGTGLQHGLKVNYLAEKDRLGTAGALSLMNPKPTRPFLVINGDVLTDLNFGRMLGFYREHEHAIVMCVRKHETRVPYGVVEIEDGRITGLREKPVCTHFINAGMYVLSPACLHLVPSGCRFDMTDLVQAVLKDGGSVGAFPVIEYWRDIGTPGDLQAASLEQQNIMAQASMALVMDEPTMKRSA